MLSVVIVHFIQHNSKESLDNGFLCWIMSFNMQLFMFITGYIGHKSIRYTIFNSVANYLKFVKKKFITLLLPFFAWPLFVNKFVFPNTINYNFLEAAVGLVNNPGGGLWFLWILFYIILFHSFFLRLSTKLNTENRILLDVLIASSILLLAVPLEYFQVISYTRSFMLCFIFFYIGVFVSKYNMLTSLFLNKYLFYLAFIVFITVSGHYRVLDSGIVNLALKMVSSLTAIVVFYYTVINITWNLYIDRFVRLIGINSLIVYVTHYRLLEMFIEDYQFPRMGILTLVIFCIAAAAFISYACVLIHRIVELCQPLNLILYGNRNSGKDRVP